VYTDTPSFIDNNDDLGALSSQLVWSMLGMFPAHPGSAELTLNGPEFPAEQLHLPGGALLVVTGAGASETMPYIQSLRVNGKPSTSPGLPASVIQTGARLDFTMGGTPNTSWGIGASDVPPSYGVDSTSAIGFVTGGPVVIPPGGTAQATFGAQSARSDAAQTVTWQTSASGGMGVSPASGQLSLAAGANATQILTLTAPTTQGRYTIPFQLTSSLGVSAPSLALPVIVANAGAFWPYFNNAGISDDGSGAANFDGVGYSYSAQALAAAGAKPGGTISAGGVTYTWPNVASGQLDNVAVGGQTIAFPSAVRTTIGLLGSATNAGSSGAQGTVTVTYADKSTQAITVHFTDWTQGAGTFPLATGNVVAITTPYRNAGGAKDTHATYVFAFSAALTSSQPVASVTLPSDATGGDIHVFDLELQ
jgi:hypothetical protein